MKGYNQLTKNDIEKICDYLKNESADKDQDALRRKDLYEIGFVKDKNIKTITPKFKKDGSLSKVGLKDDEYERIIKSGDYGPFERKCGKKKDNKYLPGPLGESIVRIYYEKLKVTNTSQKTSEKYIDKFGEEKTLNPDGYIGEKDDKSWVESKMRSYHSSGTANEKIPSVPRKYKPLGGELTLFLLADDEHKYNKEWSQACRGEIDETLDEIDKLYQKADNSVLKEIIYGTDVAKVLEKDLWKRNF